MMTLLEVAGSIALITVILFLIITLMIVLIAGASAVVGAVTNSLSKHQQGDTETLRENGEQIR